ncbi:MAG: protein kinase [Planctomycetales bacterium]|nr:protein kinase [Planctomycetales bacterium]
MPSQEDLAFGQAAVEGKFVTAAQVAECLELQEKMRALGVYPKGLAEILLDKGYLSQYLVKSIYKAQGRSQDFPRIEGYEIEGKIGHGGMGVVYRARQRSLDRSVAIKVLSASLARDRRFIGRFLREARAVAKLNHENIIVGIDVGKSNGVYYFVMEYVEGETVHEILRREKRLPERRALEIARQIALALGHAAENGLVHRDVKPDNIMMARDGVAKLCDLGLAKSIQEDPRLTQSGATHGTPHYMSPEQARGSAAIDIRSDIYSLGATLYHMLVGEVPFDGSSAAVILLKHLTEHVPSPRAKRAEISENTCHLVEKMMAKRPEHRYQDPGELLADVDRVLRGEAPLSQRPAEGESSVMRAVQGGPPETEPGTPPAVVASRRSIGVILGGGALAGVAAAALGLAVFARGGSAPPGPPPGEATSPAAPPAGSPPRTAAPDPESQATALLEEAERQRAGRPEDYDAHVLNFELIAERHRGTLAGMRAGRIAQDIRQSKESRSEERYREASEKAGRLLAEERYREAIGLFEAVADDFRGTRAAGAADREVQYHLGRVHERLYEIRMKADEVERAAEEAGPAEPAERVRLYREALDLWRRALQLGQALPRRGDRPGAVEEAGQELERLGGLVTFSERIAREARAREARDEYLRFLESVAGPLLRDREHAAGLLRLEEVEGKPSFEPVRARIARDRALVGRAQALFTRLVEALRALPAGTRVQLHPRRGRPVSGEARGLEGSVLRVQPDTPPSASVGGEGAKLVPLADLSAEDVFGLLRLGNDGPARSARGAFLAADGDLEKALDELTPARHLGEEVAEEIRGIEERLAWRLLKDLREKRADREWGTAVEDARVLRKRYGKSDVLRDHEEEVAEIEREGPKLLQERLAYRRLDSPRAKSLFAGASSLQLGPSGSGEVTAAYGLASSLGASEPRPLEAASPALPSFEEWRGVSDAAWTRGARGAEGPAGTRLAWRPALRGDRDLEVTVAVALAPGTAGAVLALGDEDARAAGARPPLALEVQAGAAVLVEPDGAGGAREIARVEAGLADHKPHALTVAVRGREASLAVDGGARARGALSTLSSLPDGRVALLGRGPAATFSSLSVRGFLDPEWLLRDPWVEQELAREAKDR